MINSFSDLTNEAIKMREKTVIAIVEAQDEHTLESVINATSDGIMSPILIGDTEKVKDMLSEYNVDPEQFYIVQSHSGGESLSLAIELINAGKAAAIMKGKLESGDFIKAIINKEHGLLAGGTLSLAGLFAPERYHKMFAVSDFGLNTYPDLGTKKSIIENAVRMLNALGIEKPKVAVLAAVEKVNRKMPETVDAQMLKEMNVRGEIPNCVIEGPISFDLATSAEAARIKGFDSPVAGDADLFIVPDFVSGNILVKCLTGFAGTQTTGAVLGAKVPVVFTSRSADASDKYNSIALAACLGCEYG